MSEFNTIAIVQARTSSTRLPGKVLKKLNGCPSIIFQLRRIQRSKKIDAIVLATTTCSSDDELAEIVSGHGYTVFRGDEKDVLKRFKNCVDKYPSKSIVRLTGDCPLIDPSLIDELVEAFNDGSWDYLGNCADAEQLSVPDGFDAEIFRADLLCLADKEAFLPSEREPCNSMVS